MTRALSVLWGHVGTWPPCCFCDDQLPFVPQHAQTCLCICSRFLSCSFTPLLLGRARGRVPPQPLGLCAGRSHRVSHWGEGGQALSTAGGPGHRAVSPSVPQGHSCSVLGRVQPSSSKETQHKPLGYIKSNFKHEENTVRLRKCDPV